MLMSVCFQLSLSLHPAIFVYNEPKSLRQAPEIKLFVDFLNDDPLLRVHGYRFNDVLRFNGFGYCLTIHNFVFPYHKLRIV